MRVRDLSPAYIGTQVRVEWGPNTLVGTLTNLDVVVDLINESTLQKPETYYPVLKAVRVTVDGTWVTLTGEETVTPLGSRT